MKSCFWTQPEGQAIATSVSTVAWAIVMLVAAYMGLRYMQARKDEVDGGDDKSNPGTLARQDSTGNAYSAVPSGGGSLNAALLEDNDDTSMLEAGGSRSDNKSNLAEIPTVLMQPYAHGCRGSSPDEAIFGGETREVERVSPWIIIGFWLLMLTHVGFMAFGAVSYWDKVHIKGGGYPVLLPDYSTEIDIQVYIATFWYNVQSFWESEAYCMACLTAFSGLIQPLIQMVCAITIAYAPLTRATRERMLTMQEFTCKIPLSSFYVEGFLLEVFKFKLDFDKIVAIPVKDQSFPLEIVAEGDVIITGFPALGYFLGGQLLYLLIVNLLRNVHRHQGFPEDLHTMRAPVEARQPTATRPRWRKLLLAGLCLLTVAVFVVVMVVPFITFTYTGKFAHYISTSTFDNDGGKMTLSRNLFEVCAQLILDMQPYSLALYYAVCAWAVLVVAPMVLVASVLVDISIPDKMVVSRRWVGEWIEGLQCWVAPESLMIATIFLGPSIGTITKFVFDANKACQEGGVVYNYGDSHEMCLTVSGRMEGFSMTCLVLYACLCWSIARISVWELKKKHD